MSFELIRREELTAQQLTELEGAMTADEAWDRCSPKDTTFRLDLGNMPITHLLKCDIEGGEKLLLQEYESLLGRSERVVMESHIFRCDHADKLETAGLMRQRIITANHFISLEYYSGSRHPRRSLILLSSMQHNELNSVFVRVELRSNTAHILIG
jgi:hypothetical protein